MITFLLTAIGTSAVWWLWLLWYRPRLINTTYQYAVTKCIDAFQVAMLQYVNGAQPVPVTPPKEPRAN